MYMKVVLYTLYASLKMSVSVWKCSLKCTCSQVYYYTCRGIPGLPFELCDAKFKTSASAKGREVAVLHTAIGSLQLSCMAIASLNTLGGV